MVEIHIDGDRVEADDNQTVLPHQDLVVRAVRGAPRAAVHGVHQVDVVRADGGKVGLGRGYGGTMPRR